MHGKEGVMCNVSSIPVGLHMQATQSLFYILECWANISLSCHMYIDVSGRFIRSPPGSLPCS
jgi:hypothetical protein